MKKTLIFDCFGVVCATRLGRWIRDNIPGYKKEEIFRSLDIGDISEQTALEEFARLVNRPFDIVQKEIDTYFVPNLELIEFIKELRQNGYPTILLSNATHDFFERFVYVEHEWIKDIFDDIIISSAIKMIKPNKDIFLYTLDKNKLTSDQCIFIDDNIENIKGAEAVGIRGIHFTNTDQFKVDLKRNLDI